MAVRLLMTQGAIMVILLWLFHDNHGCHGRFYRGIFVYVFFENVTTLKYHRSTMVVPWYFGIGKVLYSRIFFSPPHRWGIGAPGNAMFLEPLQESPS